MQSLSSAAKRFILHWGEMGSRWGINRSAAQVHALLYLSEDALSAQAIATTLSIARSNVSGSLRELQAWGVVSVVHHLGDRRDYFQSVGDAWELFRAILAQRKKREIDPTTEMLRECVEADDESRSEDAYTRARMSELLQLLEELNALYEQMLHLPPAAQRRLLRLGNKLRLISTGDPARN
jgi:DNA-binding transcriptional regulator GbsR (MarR family)